MQETIDRLNSAEQEESGAGNGRGIRRTIRASPQESECRPLNALTSSRRRPRQPRRRAAIRALPSIRRRLPTGPTPPGWRAQTRESTQNSDPESSTARLEAAREKPLSKWRLILSVFFPFAAGYYLSFLFRTINAVDLAGTGVRFWARCGRDGVARVGLFPGLCGCPDPNRRASGSIRSTASPERACWSLRSAVRHCSAMPIVLLSFSSAAP